MCYMYLAKSIGFTVAATVPLYVLDRCLIYCRILRENHRWCWIHTAVNAVVVGLTFDGMKTLLSSDLVLSYAVSGNRFNIWSSIVVMSAHLYHLLRFKVTDVSLLVHHGLMMSVLTIPYLNAHDQRFMCFADYSLFFMCGLPGMIDYFCMAMCYSGRMSRIREKRINNFLNTYIRAPGILYGAFVTYRMWANGSVSGRIAAPVIGSFMWNAQFFSNAVSISYGYALAKLGH